MFRAQAPLKINSRKVKEIELEERELKRELKWRERAVKKIEREYKREKMELLKTIPEIPEDKMEMIFRYSRSNPDKIRKLQVEKSDDKYVEGYEIEGENKNYKKFFRQYIINIEDPIDKAFIDLTI
jgi:hypothetical protein